MKLRFDFERYESAALAFARDTQGWSYLPGNKTPRMVLTRG